ncbi:MAG: PspC domain-containing protein [Balneola sp.]
MEMAKRLFRSNERMLGGVCAGIAKYLDWDPTLVRIAYLVLSIVSVAFPGILIYIILWIVIPPRY